MKKLMIAAAAAAMVGGAFAALPTGDDTINIDKNVGILHNVAITVKTLMPTEVGRIKSSGCPICPTESGSVCYLFEQGSLKINGLFASCDCDEMFKYGYFWLGSGKKATKLFDKLDKTVAEYDDLPEVEDLGVTFTAARYGKTMKKAVVELDVDDSADVAFSGKGFGSYTDAKYSYKKDTDEYMIKSTAKVSASGAILGSVSVAKLIAYVNDQAGKQVVDPAAEYMLFPVDGGCTIQLNCTEGEAPRMVPVTGTFSVKPATAKALTKVIPASCWNND